MDDFEEALRNIDVFCKVLVEKIVGDEKESNVIVEPMERLLYRKYIICEQAESSPVKHFIPLPQLKEPLIDVFENENYVRILMQCRCKDQKVTVHTSADGLEICKKKCHKDSNGTEVCIDECHKLNLPVEHLRIEDMIVKCNNNEAFEVYIPKANNNG
ncbi:MAG: hypothetical protein ACUVTB_04120 [Candidatus Bathycorpusculaceae bacterium]